MPIADASSGLCAGYARSIEGDVMVEDDADVEALAGLSCIDGALLVHLDVTSLEPLASLEAVGGLSIVQPELGSLTGLHNLRLVEHGLALGDYLPDQGCVGTGASSIEALAQLETIGSLFVCANPGVNTLAPLGPSVSGDFAGGIQIGAMPALTTLDGLQALTSVGQELRLTNLPLLATLDPLAELTFVTGSFGLSRLDGLIALEGLEQLGQVGELEIFENASLTSLAGFDGLTTITGELFIQNNPLLPQADAEAWAANIDVGSTVSICGNLDGPSC